MTNSFLDFTETSISSKTIYQGKFFHLREDDVRLSDNSMSKRMVLDHPGAVFILAFLDPNTILLERQFRYPINQHCIELPAGKRESGELPLVTAKRELLEETGYQANHWKSFLETYPCVGYANEKIEFFVATELSFVGENRDEGEFLEVLPTPFKTALEWIQSGKITETKTILALLWADRFLK